MSMGTNVRTGASTTRVAVAIITYRRPTLLRGLLNSLGSQRLGPLHDVAVRVVIVDNDPKASARSVVREAQRELPWPVSYEVEPDPGIPAARQRSVDLCANDDAVVFVDDDEICPPGWLGALLDCWTRTGADVITGPVHGILPQGVPAWNHFSDVHSSRAKHETGEKLTRPYTNNTLVTRAVLDAVRPAFDERFRFTGSSDLHFFQRVHRAGFVIRWCEEAEVKEHVPPERTTLRWLVKRAFRSGAGDTISRRLIRSGPISVIEVLFLASARLGTGLVLLAIGLLPRQQRRWIKGVRRICSAAGSYAGLFGL